MTFEIYQDFRGKWRWHLTAENGGRLATGEAYKSRRACEEAIDETRNAFEKSTAGTKSFRAAALAV